MEAHSRTSTTIPVPVLVMINRGSFPDSKSPLIDGLSKRPSGIARRIQKSTGHTYRLTTKDYLQAASGGQAFIETEASE
jgi:hypothetical protein